MRNAVVITVDADDTVIRDGAVAVTAGRIVAVGPSAELARTVDAADVVDARGGILMPALVNTHTHLAMTLFRGIADDRDLQSFLDVVFPAEAATLSAARSPPAWSWRWRSRCGRVAPPRSTCTSGTRWRATSPRRPGSG